jgi:hypothetical protein
MRDVVERELAKDQVEVDRINEQESALQAAFFKMP